MLLARAPRPFSDPLWGYEVKYDGWRMLAGCGRAGVQLKTRGGAAATTWFPEVTRSLAAVAAPRTTILDGEVCVLNELGIAGNAEFERLQARARIRGWRPGCDAVAYCVFDIVCHDGEDLLALPLVDRRERLLEVFRDRPDGILPVQYITGEGEWMYAQAAGHGMEGVCAKRLDSAYRPGVVSRDWLKIKVPNAVPAQRFAHRR